MGLYDGSGIERNSSCSNTALYHNLQCLSTSVSTLASKTKALYRASLCAPTKVSGATETAGCRSLRDVREEERHGAQPEGRDSSESIDG